MSRAEIMTILICFHFNDFRKFKHYYLFYVRERMRDLFPEQLSYNRFIELESRVAVEMMLFLQVCCLGRCTRISFIDSSPYLCATASASVAIGCSRNTLQ